MRGKLAILLLAVLIACQPATNTVSTVPTSELPPPVQQTKPPVADLCADVICSAGETCKNGECICPGKKCNGICKPDAQCCTDDECEGTCENNKCVLPTCDYNELLKDGVCECKENYTFCKAQEKCIEWDACCEHTDCPRGDRCVETVWRTRLCAKSGDKTICKLLADNGMREYLELNGTAFNIEAKKWLPDGSIIFQLSGENITLKTKGDKTFKGLTIYQEREETLGGYCKEDNE